MTRSPDCRISVIMVDGSFRESYHAIDFLAQQTWPQSSYELLWVEYHDRLRPALVEKLSRLSNARSITLNRAGEYHSSYCFNAAIAASRAELLVIIDADVAVEKDFLETVWQAHQRDERLVMYVFRLDEPREQHREPIALDHLQRVCVLGNPTNYGGCLTVRKSWLVAINGYEQHPVFSSGFHANGLDVYTRLKNLGLSVQWHPTLMLYHPWHPSTLVPTTLSQKMQRVMIEYRALQRASTCFEGIDPTRNSCPPPDLLARIEGAKSEPAPRKRKLSTRLWRWRKSKARVPRPSGADS